MCKTAAIPDSTAGQMDQANQQESPASAGIGRAARFPCMSSPRSARAWRLIALLEAVREHWAAMFAWLGVALVIDAIDGPIARRLDVVHVLPNWSGEVLDLVVDFVTYVFVPAYAITASGLLLPLTAPLLGARHCRVRRALFRRSPHESAGQSFSRISGAVECRGILSVPAACAARAGELGCRRPDRLDLCAFHTSFIRCAWFGCAG